jgi:hypothetical protein
MMTRDTRQGQGLDVCRLGGSLVVLSIAMVQCAERDSRGRPIPRAYVSAQHKCRDRAVAFGPSVSVRQTRLCYAEHPVLARNGPTKSMSIGSEDIK